MTPDPEEFSAAPTQTYYAKSVLNDGQNWFNIATLLTLAVAMPEISALIPAEKLPLVQKAVAGFVALGNLYFRIFHVRRPVAFIRSGASKPVEVRSLPDKEGNVKE